MIWTGSVVPLARIAGRLIYSINSLCWLLSITLFRNEQAPQLLDMLPNRNVTLSKLVRVFAELFFTTVVNYGRRCLTLWAILAT